MLWITYQKYSFIDTLQLLGFNYFQNKNHFDKKQIEEIKGNDCGIIELKFNSDKWFDAHEIMNNWDWEDDWYVRNISS